MRVVHIFKDAYPPLAAGITRYISDLSEASASRGHDVQVHVSGVRRSRVDVHNNVAIHRHAEVARALSMPLSPSLIVSARKAHADLIHVHLPNPIGELAAMIAPASTPIIATFHAQIGRQRWLRPAYGPLQNALLTRANAILVSSQKMAGVPELEPFSDRVHMLGFGLTPHLVNRAVVARRSPSRRLRVLFVGRLVYYKGLDVLLDAFAQVDDAQLTIVGRGPLHDHLLQRCAALSLGHRVAIRADVDDVELQQIYAEHDVVVLPSISRAEAFGLSLAEAMANNLPAISTSLGTGTDWVNVHNETGLVVEPSNVDELAGALRMMKDIDRRAKFSEAASRRTRELFSFDTHVAKVHDIYEQVLASAHEDLRS